MAGLAAGAAAAGRLGAAGVAAGRLGAAGSAIGRLGSITGAASQYPQGFASIEKMTELLKGFAPIANAAAGMVGQLGDAVKQSIPGYTALEKGITVTGEAVKTVALFVPNANKALAEFGQQLAQFVKYANPASVQKFGNALDDLHAIIGQALAPVLDLVNKSVTSTDKTLA